MLFAEWLRSAWFREAAGIIQRRASRDLGLKVSYVSLSRWRRGHNLPHDPRVIPILAHVLHLNPRVLYRDYKKDLSTHSEKGRRNFPKMV